MPKVIMLSRIVLIKKQLRESSITVVIPGVSCGEAMLNFPAFSCLSRAFAQ